MTFFFKDTAPTDIYPYGHTLSLHDALPIFTATRTASSGTALCRRSCSSRVTTPEAAASSPTPGGWMKMTMRAPSSASSVISDRSSMAARRPSQPGARVTRQIDSRWCSPLRRRRLLLMPRSEEQTSETPVTNAHPVCRLLLHNTKAHYSNQKQKCKQQTTPHY